MPKKKSQKKETYVCVRKCHFTRKGHTAAELFDVGDTIEKLPGEKLPRHFLPGNNVQDALKQNEYDPAPQMK
jgi:hypothetical protein